MANDVKTAIAKTFLEMAHGLETGQFGARPKIAVTGIGSELGEENVLAGARIAATAGFDVIHIGSLTAEGVTTVPAKTEDECRDIMESLLKSGQADAAVTMHYPFPIGVSTVGRAIAPGTGREIFIATTTGTSSTDRVEGMARNAVYGIIAAKACGIASPTVGILNVEGSRAVQGALVQLQKNGYDFKFAESQRADGGCVLRGNDVLTGASDIIVTDPLTGNILIKMLSSFTTGGGMETSGFGYGPGVGDGFDPIVMIVSRASGPPVIASAIKYAADLVRGNFREVASSEFKAAKSAGLDSIVSDRKSSKPSETQDAVTAPPEEVVTAQLSGIEIMDLEDAVKFLWKSGIYAQSGMGCTGPIILVSEANEKRSFELLEKQGFITQ